MYESMLYGKGITRAEKAIWEFKDELMPRLTHTIENIFIKPIQYVQ